MRGKELLLLLMLQLLMLLLLLETSRCVRSQYLASSDIGRHCSVGWVSPVQFDKARCVLLLAVLSVVVTWLQPVQCRSMVGVSPEGAHYIPYPI